MTQLSRSALSSSFNTNLPDNNTGLITPAVLRTELVKTIDSVVFNSGETQTITGSQNISGSLVVIGNTIFTGSLTVSGSSTFNNVGPFNQTGESLFDGPITRFDRSSSPFLSHYIALTGSLNASNTVKAITGSFRFLTGHSPITISSEAVFTEPVTFSEPITTSGSMTITGSLTVSGSGTWNNIGPLNQTGNSVFAGDHTNFVGDPTSNLPIERDHNLNLTGSMTISGSFHSASLNVFVDKINFTNLPLSDPGVVGRLYRSGSFVKVSI